MNAKKDLRIQKTEKAVREAFLELRKTTPLEKMRVRDICQMAMINTSTFYTHYSDVYSLSNHLEDTIISECIASVPDIHCLFKDPYRFLTGLLKGFKDQQQVLLILANGRHESFHEKLESVLRNIYMKNAATAEERTKVAFVLGGIMHVGHILPPEDEEDQDLLYHNLAELIEKLQ